jgi:hypothetical protein
LLGLALSRKLARMMGGDVTVTSDLQSLRCACRRGEVPTKSLRRCSDPDDRCWHV